ncbi:unnamed protein product, partial [Didymodactylos carnosus]
HFHHFVFQIGRSAENSKRIRGVQDKFVNSHSLEKEGRALVGEGVLMKICRKKPKQRAFFLFNDILVYGHVVISGRKYSQQKIIPLSEIQLGPPLDTPENPFAWLISSPKKSFIVRANSDRERQGGSVSNSSPLAPHWVPDEKATTCGKVVCDNCSKKRFLLPHVDSKPVRVCDLCFGKLTSENGDSRIRADSSDSDGEDTNQQFAPVQAC